MIHFDTMVGTLFFVLLILTGCVPSLRNPSFDVSLAEAKQDLQRMEEHPIALSRPVVVVGGFLDPGLHPYRVAQVIRQHTDDGRVIHLILPVWMDMDEARIRLIAVIDEAFPSNDPQQTIEVDVVGLSMGGIIPRDAALTHAGEKRLQLHTLFTIASPHRGASAAAMPAFLDQHKSLREGSRYLARLNDAYDGQAYTMVAYTRLEDKIVGEENASLFDENPRWVPAKSLSPSHTGAFRDERILADILRRLRHESPWSTDPPAALPSD